ncbi:MAG: hypothetical protein EBU70_03800 [Actinobacteria bacterium]|nr:hypothetical protein [Actinomycetota bacterium]
MAQAARPRRRDHGGVRRRAGAGDLGGRPQRRRPAARRGPSHARHPPCRDRRAAGRGVSAAAPRRWPLLLAVAAAVALLGVAAVRDTGPLTQQERIESISRRVACPTCQGESIAASRATAAEAIRAEIARQVATGQRSDDEIIGYLESRFGASVLLLPRSTGLDSLVWILPVAVLVVAAAALAAALARWRRAAVSAADGAPEVEPSAAARTPVARRIAVVVATVAVASGPRSRASDCPGSPRRAASRSRPRRSSRRLAASTSATRRPRSTCTAGCWRSTPTTSRRSRTARGSSSSPRATRRTR